MDAIVKLKVAFVNLLFWGKARFAHDTTSIARTFPRRTSAAAQATGVKKTMKTMLGFKSG
jgi:hypothetical protein